jgi:hypothetical protein
MSRKTHFKVYGPDHRDQGQTDHEYSNQSLCGFAGLTVTRSQKLVDCKFCMKIIKDNDDFSGVDPMADQSM